MHQDYGVLRGPYRAGPWPGLTPNGAAVLVGCAALLAVVHLALGAPRRALPDLVLFALGTLVPLAVATRVVASPGVASAVAGAYLLPRSLVSLVYSSVEPPSLLIVPALAFDVAVWFRASDLRSVTGAWPRRARVWRKRVASTRRVTPLRSVVAGGIFGAVLVAVEPPFANVLGARAADWSQSEILGAAIVAAIGCGVIALSARGTESPPPTAPTPPRR